MGVGFMGGKDIFEIHAKFPNIQSYGDQAEVKIHTDTFKVGYEIPIPY